MLLLLKTTGKRGNMRLDRSEIDIGTLVAKIASGQIDIQPNFQRGEVWPEAKKKRLIDTVLRGWYIPAIHIVVDEERDREEVLDGQQRLRSLIAFMDDEFTIDGSIQPFDQDINELSGLRFSELPTRTRSRFLRFPISTVRLREFMPEEPGELFFRLNQLTALTSAEQRNALIGEPRNQVKDLVSHLERQFEGTPFGFSNFRLAYDEVIARLITSFESGDLRTKLTARHLEQRYRQGFPFQDRSYDLVHFSVNALSDIYRSGSYSKLNKASLFSWLFFLGDQFSSARRNALSHSIFFAYFESKRANPAIFQTSLFDEQAMDVVTRPPSTLAMKCIEIFNDRTFARVNDVSSILLRDLALNFTFADLIMQGVLKPTGHFAQWLSEKHFMGLIETILNLPEFGGARASAETELSNAWGDFRENHRA